MTEYKLIEIEWPCGLRIKCEYKSGILQPMRLDIGPDIKIEPGVCPMHGKDCPPQPQLRPPK